MSSQKFAIPFRVQLKRSFILSVLLLSIHGGALIIVSLLAWPIWLKLALMVVVVWSCIVTAKRHLFFKGRDAVVGLVWEGDDRWTLISATGEQLRASLLSGTSMQPWLAVMSFRVEGERRAWPVVVMVDSTDSTSFRRLHIKLRRAIPVSA